MITPIPTPAHLLPHKAVIIPPTITPQVDGTSLVTYSGGDAVTVAAHLQPLSSRDQMIYGRETGTTVYRLFFVPTVSLTPEQLKNARIIVNDGRNFRAVGDKIDACTNGCIYELTVEEDF